MYFYLIFFALYNGHQACKDGVKGEDHIVELNGIDAGRVAVEVLNLEKKLLSQTIQFKDGDFLSPELA